MSFHFCRGLELPLGGKTKVQERHRRLKTEGPEEVTVQNQSKSIVGGQRLKASRRPVQEHHRPPRRRPYGGWLRASYTWRQKIGVL
jgi:hypothetical protein